MHNNRFLRKAQEVFNQMREIRRDLHQHPELGLQEKRTSGIVADYLERLGLDVKRVISKILIRIYMIWPPMAAFTTCIAAMPSGRTIKKVLRT